MKKQVSRRVKRLRKHARKLGGHAKKMKAARWLLPGWVGYEYYQVHKLKGHSRKKSVVEGAKAEALRMAVAASVPVPGTYELTTVGLASLKEKIEKDELERLTLRAFKEVSPVRRLRQKRGALLKEVDVKR